MRVFSPPLPKHAGRGAGVLPFFQKGERKYLEETILKTRKLGSSVGCCSSRLGVLGWKAGFAELVLTTFLPGKCLFTSWRAEEPRRAQAVKLLSPQPSPQTVHGAAKFLCARCDFFFLRNICIAAQYKNSPGHSRSISAAGLRCGYEVGAGKLHFVGLLFVSRYYR